MPLPSQDVRVHDALIIGAGPVGLTLAHELARRGVAPLVIDRASGIREVSKALILHVRTQEALASMGLTQALRAEAEPLTEIVVHAYGKHVGSWHMDGIDSAAPHPLILGQNRTQHLLLDGLARHGGEVHWGVEATTLEVRDDGASATLRGPDGTETTVEARYVVGCEGSNSLTRKTLGLNFEGERYSGESSSKPIAGCAGGCPRAAPICS
jgi:3-(3-hydroxy-phenyl)propionate hydroxylase